MKTEQHKLPPNTVKDFILGGNAMFTMVNSATQKRYTYKISAPKDNKESNTLFAKVMTDYLEFVYIGAINKQKNEFYLTRASKMKEDSGAVVYIKWLLRYANSISQMEKIEVWHHGTCGCCGRTLTDPESIEAGFGSWCLNNVVRKNHKHS